ncbi:MAG: PLP-dependent aspartate aminotransferase family protein, partial [Chloroflexota bacterium]|nr:PLP-dependent aspartate aminotransferase family protein [Chloroflexota bacterium]
MNQSDAHTSWALDTQLVHGGGRKRKPMNAGVPTVQPIYTSTTYLHQDAETLDQAFSGTLSAEEPAFVYARQGNPNASSLEWAMAQAEGGVGAVTFGSGMAAIHVALLAAGLIPGKKLVAAQDLYGPTTGLLRTAFSPLGVEVILLNLCSSEAADRIRAEKPDVIYVETLSNPLVKLIDLDAISAVAHEIGAITIVDSTFTTPYVVRPIEHGFDLVVHSATKYLGGHGDSTAGVVISATQELLELVRRYGMMQGATLSPFESYLVMRGLKTLPLRMERHCSNALQVAHFLQEQPTVAKVHYPGLPTSSQHTLAKSLFTNERYGGLLSFELKEQSRRAAFRFMDRLQLCLPATTLG